MHGLCECGCGEKTPIATKSSTRDGWVKGQPMRFVLGHNRRQTPHAYVEEDRGHTTSCWVWVRALNSKGYGIVTSDGKRWVAHRLYYVDRFGPVPDGYELDHLCRVRACVNPEHLEPVTPEVNRQRGANAKLSHTLVREIRNASGTHREIASRYGVSHTTVGDIKSGKRWANIV